MVQNPERVVNLYSIWASIYVLLELVGNQKKLRLKTLKIKKLNDRHRKINSREKSSLYLRTFSLTTNQYLHSGFEDLLIKSTFFSSSYSLISRNPSLLNYT